MAESISVTDFRTLKGIRTNAFQNRNLAITEPKPILALDTETDRNGDVLLIADSDGRYLDKITTESLISWLFSKYQGSWNFFYNLTFDAEVILKTLPDDILELYKNSRLLQFKFNEFRIEYQPSKRLVIRKGHHSSIFFDIAQFYHASLVNAYQNNIGKLPETYLEMKEKRKSFSKTYYDDHRNEVRKYCIFDCKLTKELSEHWIKLFYSAFRFYPARWISSGYLAEKVLNYNRIYIPKFDEIPYEVQELAYNSYFGGRFEILKRGFIGTAHLYDINSAYPYALTKIPELRHGKWIKSKKIEPKSQLGFFKIKADIPDVKFVPPFPFRKDLRVVFPSGKFVTYCTLEELKAIEDPNFYTILDSVQYYTDNQYYPYKEFIEKLYKKRLELKHDKNPLQLPLKIILNSIYGKTGETVKGKIGNMFNPVIFSFITGHARSKLYQFVKEHDLEQDVVSFATDSICTTKKINVDSVKLGDFSLDKSANDVFYLQNGIYRFNKVWKSRGIGSLGIKQIEHLDTIERGDKLFMKCKILRPNRLRSSILQDSISKIGKFSEFEREINLNADKKRLWFDKLSSVESKKMNVSTPLPLNFLSKNSL